MQINDILNTKIVIDIVKHNSYNSNCLNYNYIECIVCQTSQIGGKLWTGVIMNLYAGGWRCFRIREFNM